MPRNYNLKSIRTLLTEGFSERELRTLCHENFKAVHHELASSDGITEIVSRLLDCAERKLEFDKLLVWAKATNPARYQQHQPYYDENLETDHLPATTNGGLKAWWQGLFYPKKYLQHLIYRHRDFDVKGLSTQGIYALELERVFVELSIAPQPPHQTSADPIHPTHASLSSGSHVIWDYLNAKAMQNQHLAIIGPPGSGKTTLVKHMTLTLAAKNSTPGQYPKKLPILLFLRDHAATIKDKPTLSLAEAIQSSMAHWEMQAPPGWFEGQLSRGGCLVLLDGLDEVADPETRRKVVEWVERQLVTQAKNRFIITSRPFGYRSNPLSGVAVLEVRPFTGEQIRKFVYNWYRANEIMSAQKDDPGVAMKAQEGAEDLLRRMRNAPALSDLAVNPLLLTMIATVHHYRSSLPGRRVELYAEIFEVFLGKRQQARGLELDLTPAQKQRVLQPLAYFMMEQKIREISQTEVLVVIAGPLQLVNPSSNGADFLKMIENSSGLLLERESGVYSFAHLTFQEYLAAVYAQEQKLDEQLVAHIADSWWHETLRLYSAQADATSLIATCLAADKPAVPILALASECLAEAREVQPDVRARLNTILEQGVEDQDPERRLLVAETLLALRLRLMRRISEDKYVDDTLIAHAEYQLFLDEQRDKRNYYQPDHWLAFQFPAGQSKLPVVGVRPGDAAAFCDWLTEREPSEWRYRLPVTGQVEEEMGLKVGPVGYWVTTTASDCVLAGSDTPAKITEMIKKRIAGVLTLDLTRFRTLAHDHIHDFDVAHDRAYALALARTLNRTLDLNLSLDHDLDRTHDRLLGRYLAHTRVHAHAVDLARTRTTNLDLAYTYAAHASAHTSRLRAQGFTRARAHTLDLDLERARALDRVLALVLGRNPGPILDQVRSLEVGWPEVSDFLRWYIRLATLLVAAQLLDLLPPQSQGLAGEIAARFRSGSYFSKSEEDEIRRSAEAHLDLYVDFVILEERVQGHLPAFEGIRIVKERKRESS